jgi:hypothetical protein
LIEFPPLIATATDPEAEKVPFAIESATGPTLAVPNDAPVVLVTARLTLPEAVAF